MSVYITKSLKAELKADELYKLVQASLEDTISGDSEEEESWVTIEEKREKRKEQDRKKESDPDRDRDRDGDERSDRNNVKSSKDKHKESKREKEERKMREKEERRKAKEDRKRHKEKKSNKKEKEPGQSQTKMANDKIDMDDPIETECSVPDGADKTKHDYKEDGGLNVNTYSRQIDLHDEELISAVTNLQHSTPDIKLIEKESLPAKTKRKSGSILSHTVKW